MFNNSSLVVTLDQLNAINPASGQSGYCSGKKGCNTNQDAVAAINNAITKYNIKTRAQAVAVVAVMALESDYWMYNVNVFPGRTGQGTKAMMMYNFVYSYAQSLYPDKVDPNAGSLQPASAANNATMNGIRDLVTSTPNDSFGAGFWYLTQSPQGKPFYADPAKLRDGNADDFNAYSTQGLGAPADPQRTKVWQTVDQYLLK
ncbi:hypothetical protein H4R18_003379 [Coemansia javaensis]|uniref:Uncharacterized protein n=1 Tax=Coemansia javaensis TaxID=2761396 RepID=A0A9W8LGE9_9FUNG|nr:hypothetical protein H4R18_003379 [Coemansia javaensis]